MIDAPRTAGPRLAKLAGTCWLVFVTTIAFVGLHTLCREALVALDAWDTISHSKWLKTLYVSAIVIVAFAVPFMHFSPVFARLRIETKKSPPDNVGSSTCH